MAVGRQRPIASHTAPADRSERPPDAPAEPPHAESARSLVSATTVGSLATVSVDVPGYPFGSVVNYALDDEGNPLLLLSDLAEHTRNLKADSRASLMATESGQPGEALGLGRVTLVGDLRSVEPDRYEAVRAVYLEAHPGTGYADFADFNFYRLGVKSVRYVGGFGRMSWVDARDYASAQS